MNMGYIFMHACMVEKKVKRRENGGAGKPNGLGEHAQVPPPAL